LKLSLNGCFYCVACSYIPPKPSYDYKLFISSLVEGIETAFSTFFPDYIIVAGDFNTIDCSQLENQCGLAQLVSSPTHGSNILDKFYTNRPDVYSAEVCKSLIRTKHLAVVVKGLHSAPFSKLKRTCVKLYDLREHNLNFLRISVANFNWSPLFESTDIDEIYSIFLQSMHALIEHCIPVKNVRLGPRDPPFVTPLIKSLLKKRLYLRKHGRIREADDLAVHIDELIRDIRSKQLAGMTHSSNRELWNAVKTNSKRRNQVFPPHIFSDVDAVNSYYAKISTNSDYSIHNVINYAVPLNSGLVIHTDIFECYRIERLLRNMKTTSPGHDGIPSWLFRHCSFELADVVAHVFRTSITTGMVPSQWHYAVVTPVPKVSRPTSIADYRPISVTPLLSRVLEKIVVQNWLLPAIPSDMISDQFGFRPTGSTTCALAYILHQVAVMLEDCDYVRCLLIDFSKAFDVVDHAVLLSKLSLLDLPHCILNWLISFLTDRSQVVKCGDILSLPMHINSGIVQGSGIGPTMYIIMESDLRTLSRHNFLCKYADDTNLIVPGNSDIGLQDEFSHICSWAKANKMIINMGKTKEIVFRRPNVRSFHMPPPISNIDQVDVVNLLGVLLPCNFCFDDQVGNVLKLCSQRVYLLKLLRDQGLTREQLHTVFLALVVSRLRYALPAWSGFLKAEQIGQMNAFLKRVYKYGLCSEVLHVETLVSNSDKRLFRKMSNQAHCLHFVLPPLARATSVQTRSKGHPYELPRYKYDLTRKSFVLRCLYNFV